MNRNFSRIACAALGLLIGPTLLHAGDGPAFKRLSAPSKGSAPKIDVQIDPDTYFDWFENAPDLPEPSALLKKVPPSELPFPSFWAAIGPGAGFTGMQPLQDALAATGLDGPRLQEMQTLADRFASQILRATVDTRVSPALALAVMQVESAGVTDAVSSAGAQGLMQLIPATADRFDVADPMDAGQNIQGGVAYLDWLMGEFGGNPYHVIAAYNAGENNVIKHDGAPPFAETRAYVPKVLAAWNVARGLCMSPPELISDPCVLRTREVARDG